MIKTATIEQEVVLDGIPSVIYSLLTDEKKHAAFTGAPAKIAARSGGKFSVWDGYITGKNISLIKDKKIVQEWHASDMPEGHISILTIEFIPGKNKTTILKMTHADVPATQINDFAKGWKEFYWSPMQAWLHRQK